MITSHQQARLIKGLEALIEDTLARTVCAESHEMPRQYDYYRGMLSGLRTALTIIHETARRNEPCQAQSD